MASFVAFMPGAAGRLLRVVAGLALALGGALMGPWGWALIAAGLVPLFAGVSDVCLLAPLFGQPLRGVQARRTTRMRHAGRS